jgi:hypothetical protein
LIGDNLKAKPHHAKMGRGFIISPHLDHKLLYMNIKMASIFNPFSLSDLVVYLD